MNNKDFYKEASDWYQDRYETIKVERNRYFFLLLVCLGVLALSLLVNLMLMPLKRVEPYVVEIDKSTGLTTVLQPTSKVSLRENESVSIYFLYKYLNARMSYDWALRQTNADIVRALSNTATYREYARFMDVNNPDSPIKKYQTTSAMNVHILSHSFPYPNISEIHFYTELTSKTNIGAKPVKQFWVATIKYTYANNSLSLGDREHINPLGFFVTSFQLNQEVPQGAAS
ncbi:MAG TPA: type IV secretion system protein [Coxiellaceae bacterium]|nr:type IV secretion system protein [Coxiellaceae bacterium]